MKKPFYLLFTPCNIVDVDPIDHGNILQPENQHDHIASTPMRIKLLEVIPLAIGIGFVVLTFILSYTLK